MRNLWDIIESCKKTLPLHHLQNKRVCIDLSCWIVQLHNVNKTYCGNKEKVYLKCLFHRLRALIALNCSIIFVTDGSIPSIKLSTYRRRINPKGEVPIVERNVNEAVSLRRNKGSEFSCMIKEAKILGKALGIPCLDGIEEAEAQCALLNSESLCDACFTSDSDAFLFGARTVYREICLGEGGYVICYEMADIERKLGFGRNSLITLAILLGCDYFDGVHGIGPESACQIVKSAGDATVLHRIASEGLLFAKKPKGSKNKGQPLRENHDKDANKCDLQTNGQFLKVINAYLKPKCHLADSDSVHKVLAVYPFNLHQLQQICSQFFDWCPEKTDEYILPKIAERELRRYANLRSTSSNLGVMISFDKMPVKCPISSIVKQRKLQGRDCFEVSWDEMHGLNSSIVPVDLVESACPEKILEFQEQRGQKKKTKSCKPKAKKPQDGTSVEEVEHKLQQLLVEIKQENATKRLGILSRGPMLENVDVPMQADQTNLELHLETQLDSKTGRTTSTTSYSREVIDLMSPSPPVNVRGVSRCKEVDVPCIDIIDLGESENEFSADHARKARDLRLFIGSIKDD